jgi:hypothetical protein
MVRTDLLPDWLAVQLRSSLGRSGRGRLWADDRFKDFSVPWPEKPTIASKHCEGCVGIVVNRADAEWLFKFPGTLLDRTFTALRLKAPEGEPCPNCQGRGVR